MLAHSLLKIFTNRNWQSNFVFLLVFKRAFKKIFFASSFLPFLVIKLTIALNKVFFFFLKCKYLKKNYILTSFFLPYFDLLVRLVFKPSKSYLPLIKWYFTPGKSGTRPPRIKACEYSCKL